MLGKGSPHFIENDKPLTQEIRWTPSRGKPHLITKWLERQGLKKSLRDRERKDALNY